MRDTSIVGIKMVLLGLFGNMGVSAFAWFHSPDIFKSELSEKIVYTVFGSISYGDLSNCVYMIFAIGVLFAVVGMAFIFDRKHFI